MTVVLGYVDRPEARAALDQALAVVRRTGERLVVVSARRVGSGSGSGASRRPPESGLAAVEERLVRESVPHVVLRQSRGRQPADELREAVIANRAALLVIGMRGAGAVLGQLLRGTTAQALLLDPPCDVLVVKAPIH